MKTLVCLFITLLFFVSINGQTPVPPGNVSGTWNAAGSPYLVNGDIIIPNDSTLMIMPGVKVMFQDSYTMFVQGQILAQGTEVDSIIFTAADTTVGFNSIRFLGTPPSNDTSRFEYCLFTYGKAHGPYPDNFGGALASIDFGKIIVDHCRFAHNTAVWKNIVKPGGGAAIAVLRSNLVIRNCMFEYNRGCIGGVLMLSTDSSLVENNIFQYNTAPYFDDYREGLGGVIFCKWDSYAVIRGNVFYRNHADIGAGAVYFWNYGNARVENNIMYENDAGVFGGAMRMDSCSSPTIINNTVVNNEAVERSGGIDVHLNSNPEIYNTILWGNTALDGSQVYISSNDCTPDFYYSDIQGGLNAFGGHPFTGNYINCIVDNPLFLETGEHPYQINDNSPCIDEGTPDTTGLNLPEYDLAGEVRIFNDRVDMGAYEWNTFVGLSEIANKSIILEAQICPNPFTTSTTLSYELKQPEKVFLSIYNHLGQIVYQIAENQPQGKQQLKWNAEGYADGIYYYRLQVGDNVANGKMVKVS